MNPLHVKWYWKISKQKALMRWIVLFYISVNIFHVWLNEDSWVLSASTISCDMLFHLKFIICPLTDVQLEKEEYVNSLFFFLIIDIFLWCNTQIQQLVVFKKLAAMWNLRINPLIHLVLWVSSLHDWCVVGQINIPQMDKWVTEWKAPLEIRFLFCRPPWHLLFVSFKWHLLLEVDAKLL